MARNRRPLRNTNGSTGLKSSTIFDISVEQLKAWSRWKLYEKHRGNEQSFFQEFPPLEDYAWQMSGSKFSAIELTDTQAHARSGATAGRIFPIYDRSDLRHDLFGDRGAASSSFDGLGRATTRSESTLSPRIRPLGARAESDRFCIEVLKCYADGIGQVAEFCTTECTTYAFRLDCRSLGRRVRNQPPRRRNEHLGYFGDQRAGKGRLG